MIKSKKVKFMKQSLKGLCHVSCVTCHVSHVTCHVYFFLLFFGQSCEARQWRVCYQRVLTRIFKKNNLMNVKAQWQHVYSRQGCISWSARLRQPWKVSFYFSRKACQHSWWRGLAVALPHMYCYWGARYSAGRGRLAKSEIPLEMDILEEGPQTLHAL